MLVDSPGSLPVPAEWQQAIHQMAAAPKPLVALVLGPGDCGKSTFCLQTANSLAAAGERVAVVDADMGQSDIGPPGTLGLGYVTQPAEALSSVEPASMYFIGDTSPVGHLLPTVLGTARLVGLAKNGGASVVLVDTTGLVTGAIGRELKSRKMELLRPDYVVAFSPGQELAAVLRPWAASRATTTVSLATPPSVRRKSPELRQQRRQESFGRYFAEATSCALPLEECSLSGTRLGIGRVQPKDALVYLSRQVEAEVLYAERATDTLVVVTDVTPSNANLGLLRTREGVDDVVILPHSRLEGLVVGLHDETLSLLALGRLQWLEGRRRRLVVSTPLRDATPVRHVAFGRLRLDDKLQELEGLRPGDL